MAKNLNFSPAYKAMLESGRKRRARALKLRNQGKKLKEIAAALKISHQRAHQMIVKARMELGE